MKIADLKADVYGWTIRIVVSKDIKKVMKYLRKKAEMCDVKDNWFDCLG